MKLIQEKIWLEVGDWEAAGYKLHTIIDSIGKERKSWRSITTSGKGREMLFLYESLGEKHKALFAEAVKRFEASLLSQKASDEMQDLRTRVLIQVQPSPQDVEYFHERGFVGHKHIKATVYARRAAWLRFLAEVTPSQVRERFRPLRSKEELLAYCLPLVHADGCFEFRKANLQYLKIRIVKWNKEGIDSCIDGRNDKRNALKKDEKTEKILRLIIQSLHKPTAYQVWEFYDSFTSGRQRVVSKKWGEIYDRSEYESLSYATVQAYMRRPTIKAYYDYVHGSELTFRSKHDDYLERERPQYFGSMISCDDWDMPINVSNGQKAKAYLFFDVATRHCVGYSWSYSKDKALFVAGLTNMLENDCWQGKMPYELQTEKNLISEFQKEGGALVNGELFTRVTVLPKNPMAKYAESDIRNLKYQILAKHEKYSAYFKGRHYARREANKLEKDDQKKVLSFVHDEIGGFLADIIGRWNKLHPVGELNPILVAQKPERLAWHLVAPIETTYKNTKFAAKKKNWHFVAGQGAISKLVSNALEVRFWGGVPYVFQGETYLGSAVVVQKAQASIAERTGDQTTGFYKSQYELAESMAQLYEDETLTGMEQEQEEAPEETYAAPKVAMPIGPEEEEEEEEDFLTKLGSKVLREQKSA